jgi:membrane-associated phospholipid phosphatase
LLFLTVFSVLGEDAVDEGSAVAAPAPDAEPVSVFATFHDIGWNLLHSFTYNYGLNFVAAGAGTYGMIAGGLDWAWYKAVYDSEPLMGMGNAANIIGFGIPVAAPVAAYAVGRCTDDRKLQVLGAALAQTAITATGLQIFIKVWTGRRQAGIADRDPQTTDYSDDFAFGFLRRGFVDGWPSGHMMNAVAAAVVVSEIYDDDLWIKMASYAYAAAIGIGMTFSDHWTSDVFAGALMGYAIGKTIGKSFKALLKPQESEENAVSFYFTPSSFGVRIRI